MIGANTVVGSGKKGINSGGYNKGEHLFTQSNVFVSNRASANAQGDYQIGTGRLDSPSFPASPRFPPASPRFSPLTPASFRSDHGDTLNEYWVSNGPSDAWWASPNPANSTLSIVFDPNSEYTAETDSFESSFDGWSDSDFFRNSGTTPTGNTGPSSASSGEFYVYAEASNNFPGVEFALWKDFDDSVAKLTFQYHLYASDGVGMGTVQLMSSTDGGSTFTTLWSKSRNKGDAWKSAAVDVAGTSGTLRIQFKYTTGSSYQGDFALDGAFGEGGRQMPDLVWSGLICTDNGQFSRF